MTLELLKRHWGLAVALVLAAPALILAARALVGRSAWGQLRAARRTLENARRELHRQTARHEHGKRRAADLERKAAQVKPRVLEEAREAVIDAAALVKIRHDQVLVAENHVRKIIHSEYSPERQVRLRAKYLPDDGDDARPFSF